MRLWPLITDHAPLNHVTPKRDAVRMSLTGMLGNKNGRLRAWWDQELPGISAHTSAGIWRGALAAPPTSSAKPHAGMVGTAFDYRLRWLWPAGPANDLIGVAFANVEFGEERAATLAKEVDAFTQQLAGPASMTDPAMDEALTRLSLVLARLETVFRCGMPIDPTAGVRADATLEAMMAAQPTVLIDDIRSITAASRATIEPLMSQPAILNPVFTRSGLVGGADGDLVVNGCLLDVKTTTMTSLPTNDLRQIVSYALLDDIDEHKISRVGLLYARRPQLLTWDLDDLLTQSGANTRAELSTSLIGALSVNPIAAQQPTRRR